MNKVVGITGGTGGLGKRLSEYLISKGFKVRALVRKTSDISHLVGIGVDIVYGDINDINSLKEFIKDIDICYHIAAQVKSTTKEQFFKVNIDGTRNICEAISKYNSVCRLIYCSSIVVKNVTFIGKIFLSNYTMSKYYAEKVIDEYKKKGLKITIIYPGYIYGPNDRNFMPQIIQMLQYGIKFFVKGGEKNVPVIYIDDLCELFYLSSIKEIAIGKAYVSLKRNDIGIHEFIRMIARKMNYTVPDKVYSKRVLVLIAFIMSNIYRIFRIKKQPKITMRIIGALSNSAKFFNDEAIKDLGWNHRVGIEEGIDKALLWYKENY